VSRIEPYESSEQCSMGIRLMIIKLRKYIEVREPLIESGITGLQAQVSYQNEDQRVSVLGWLSTWRRRDGDANRIQGCIQLASTSGMRTGMHMSTVEQSKKH